jgi:endonuclease/exonuclease/phosphatase family metal-dependent hydrolase
VKLRVATYNIRNGDADDGPNSWPLRKELTVECIRDLDASIIGLQEAMSYQLDYIMNALPDYAFVGVGRIDGAKEGEFAPILYRKAELQPSDAGWFMLSETPEVPGSTSWNTACERICTWADFGRLNVFNTHLDHISEEARSKGVELILSRIKGHALVMGDFNDCPGDVPVQRMIESGFADACAGEDTFTFHDWGRAEGGRIDYIFGRGVMVSDGTVHAKARNGRHGSDHFPVSALIEY